MTSTFTDMPEGDAEAEASARQKTKSASTSDIVSDTLHHRLLGPSIQKSGQEGVDQAAISKIIYNASVGSKYFEHQQRKEAELSTKVDAVRLLAEKVSRQELDAASDRISARIKQLEVGRDLSQTIVHLDCDAFYASVEELDRPDLKSKPFAVGGGVLCTCNYVARKYGVRSAMAKFVAMKICPELIVLPLNFPKYIEKSDAIKKILTEYDPNLCAMTLDEAYMNITEYCQRVEKSPEEVVSEMRRRVQNDTRLTVSAGIGPNSRVAKIASNVNKPNGQFVVPSTREGVMDFMKYLPVRKVTGIGYVLERQLNALGVNTCGDILAHAPLISEILSDIQTNFLLDCYLGLGSTVVRPIEQYERKSVGCERTFQATSDPVVLKRKIWSIAQELEKDCKRLNIAGRKFGFKYKKDTFELVSRIRVMPKQVNTSNEFYKYGVQMLERELPITVRLIGLRITDLVDLRREGPMRTFLRGTRTTDPAVPSGSSDEVKHWKPLELESMPPVTTEEADELDDLDMMIQSSQTAHDVDDTEPRDELRSVSKAVAESQSRARNSFKDAEAASSLQEQLPQAASNIVACPMCGNHVSSEPSALNAHIDWCLSRDAIRQAVGDTFTQ
ncbi:uncharacterized protein V1518DRAFT_412067 [Limtongia smithiae]|uniref:uncharacterized protein n=1 Tax=Limtongia smithiae TaxID=1125753 RepID=UPI0034CD32AC